MRSYGTTAEMQRNTKLMGIEEIEEDGVCNNLMKNNIEEEKIPPIDDDYLLATHKAPERLNMSTPLLKNLQSSGNDGSSSPMSCFSSCSSSLLANSS
jgi:hypothetical protein